MAIKSLFTEETSAVSPFLTDGFTTAERRRLEIGFIKHASLMLLFDGHVIYIDPLTEYADYAALPKADAILVTHGHYDHFDQDAINAAIKPGTILVVNEEVSKQLKKPHVNIIKHAGTSHAEPVVMVMHNGDRVSIGGQMGIEAVPAYNTTPGRDKYHPRGRDNGYILSMGGSVVYISGDTEDIPEMHDFGHIDIAFIPVNQPYTMTVEQAAHAARILKPEILYPYHYGDTDIGRLPQLLKCETNTEVRLRDMQ